ncbi:hypothetical protein [Moraxella bovis]|uniref:hypothetical protein n=1 Tax=Moraxella bovis TaxID=476 RepID=UPI00222776CA|nr:hypothetical protein [Moraxella bovis]UYZ94030.1 hypothetical protein LP121_09035 [Moraxella bovis]
MTKLKISDKEITIRPIKVKDLPAVCVAVEPFIDRFNDISKGGQVTNSDLFRLCAMHSPDVVNLCAILTDADREWLKEQEPKALFELTCEVIKLSQDFFLNQILSPLNKIGKTLTTLALTTT